METTKYDMHASLIMCSETSEFLAYLVDHYIYIYMLISKFQNGITLMEINTPPLHTRHITHRPCISII